MIYEDIVIIIPSLNPDNKLLNTLEELTKAGFKNIILVNDGSGHEYDSIFEIAVKENGVHLLKHSINLGQGRAYKTGFNYYLENFPNTIGVLQCDADGQHHIHDIIQCAELMRHNPYKFILGVREFKANGKNKVPFRSRFGNILTSWIFRYLCGLNIKDTQSGLKGIPKNMIPCLMETTGERFEYATSVLLNIKSRGYQLLQFGIKTIYIEDNASSHFKPIRDSIKIYATILKYSISSFVAVGMDFLLFNSFVKYWGGGKQFDVYTASILASIIAGIFNFLINKTLVFRSKGGVFKEICKYYTVSICRAIISAFCITNLLSILSWNIIIIKAIVDTILFFIVYYLQNTWVFKRVIRNDQNEGA